MHLWFYKGKSKTIFIIWEIYLIAGNTLDVCQATYVELLYDSLCNGPKFPGSFASPTRSKGIFQLVKGLDNFCILRDFSLLVTQPLFSLLKTEEYGEYLESLDGFLTMHIFLNETFRKAWIYVHSTRPMGFATVVGGKNIALMESPSC